MISTELFSDPNGGVEFGGQKYRISEDKLAKITAGTARLVAGRTFDGRPNAFLIEHEGTTVGLTTTSYGGGDSDDLALYWDGEKVASAFYRTTRGGGTDGNSAAVDATPEVVAAVVEWETVNEVKRIRADELHRWKKDVIALSEPKKGDRVTVVRGRKVALGTTGVVFWLGDKGFGLRVGLKDEAGETHWTAAGNVRVEIDPDDIPLLSEYRGDDLTVLKAARERASARYARLFCRSRVFYLNNGTPCPCPVYREGLCEDHYWKELEAINELAQERRAYARARD